MSGAARYGIYFAPAAKSKLWRFGCDWLGRDVEAGEERARPPIAGPAADDWSAAELSDLTASPRLYGFHGTLKPPFRLAAGETRESLCSAVAAFARSRSPFVAADVDVAALGRFIAFRLIRDDSAVRDLAAATVETFDRFRAPAPPEELAKRRASGLTPGQDALLERWGYPYVMDEFRFHLTLTGPIADAARRERLAAVLRRMAAARGAIGPLAVDGVAIYEQSGEGGPFWLFRRLPFGG